MAILLTAAMAMGIAACGNQSESNKETKKDDMVLERVWKIISAICKPHFAVYFTLIFILQKNFNRHPVKMVLNECYTNLITDEILTGSIKLQTYQYIVMQKK